MVYCKKCGALVNDGVPFCPECGAPVASGMPQGGAAPQGQIPQQPYQQQYQQQYRAPYQQPYSPTGNPKDHTAEFSQQDISDNKVFAMAPYLLGVLGTIIALLAAQKSDFAMFHVRQAVKLDLCSVLLVIICIVPFLGWLVAAVGAIIIFVLKIIMFFRVCRGLAVDVPIVGDFGFLK